jgi:hypothetical protein
MGELLPTHDLLHSSHAFSCCGPSAARKTERIPQGKNCSRILGIETKQQCQGQIEVIMIQNRCRYSENKAWGFDDYLPEKLCRLPKTCRQ